MTRYARIKKVLFYLMAVLAFLFVNNAFAQNPVSNEHPAPAEVDGGSDTAGLDADLVAEMRAAGIPEDEIDAASVAAWAAHQANLAGAPEALPAPGQPIDLNPEQSQELTRQPTRAELAIWEAIEVAYHGADWDQVRALAAQLPFDQYGEEIQLLLQELPRQRPAFENAPDVSLDQELAMLAQEEADRAQLAQRDEAVRQLQLATDASPGDKTLTPAGSGIHPAGSAPIPPPAVPTEAVPEAVLTVGAACTYANLQAAVTAAASGDTIWLHGTTWTGSLAAVNINAKSLYIYGGLNASCTSLDGSQTVFDLNGFGDSAFEIYGGTGLTVQLHHFDITGSSGDGDYGGGIEIDSDHTVELYDTAIYGNNSTFGGGVHMDDAGASLLLDDVSRIRGNTADDDGGGVFCANGAVTLTGGSDIGVLGGNIADNDGDNVGNGGGAYLDNCDLTLNAQDGSFVEVLDNQASYGGGVYATNNSFVAVQDESARISNNTANLSGGGVYVTGGADVYVDSGQVNNNSANIYGGGVYVTGSASVADFDNTYCTSPPCSQLNNNDAGSFGGAAYVSASARLDLEGVYVEGNQAGSLGSAFYGIGSSTFLDLDSVMITDGTGGINNDYVIRLISGARSSLDNSTIAGNSNTGDGVFGIYTESRLDSFGLIAWNNDATTLVDGPGDVTIDCSILQEDFPGSDNVVSDPLFQNAAAGNYNLSRTSPAIDHCNGAFSRDVDYEIRPNDVAGVTALRALETTGDDLSRTELNATVTRVVRVPREAGTITAIVDTLGSVYRYVDYGSSLWIELDETQFARLQESRIDYQEITDFGTITFDRFRFDPVRDGEPGFAASLNGARLNSSGSGLYFVQLRNPATPQNMDLIESGGTPIQYYPNHTFLMWTDQRGLDRLQRSPDVRWVGAYHSGYRILQYVEEARADAGTDALLRLHAYLLDDGSLAAIESWLNDRGGTIVTVSDQHVMNEAFPAVKWKIDLPVAEIDALAQQPQVLNIDLALEPDLVDERSNQIIADNAPNGNPVTGYNAWLFDIGYDGSGVKVAIVDSGIDWDHQDLNVVSGDELSATYTETGEPGSDGEWPGAGHGTHVAGIVAGDGGSGLADSDGFLYGLGVAPGATLHAMDTIDTDYDPRANIDEMVSESADSGADLSNNSWRFPDTNGDGYVSYARDQDTAVLDAITTNGSVRDFFLTVFAAGNEGDNCASPPCTSIIGSPPEAKNVIAVGSTDSDRSSSGDPDEISSFSSRGPAQDGRIKPDVMAPGNNIISTENRVVETGGTINNSCATSPSGSTIHSFCNGTSMASPHVTGVAALFTEFWHVRNNTTANPLPSLVKAALIATTDDLGGADDGWGNIISNRPNQHQGWGRVNANRLLSPTVPIQFYQNPQVLLSTSDLWSLNVRPYDTSEPMRITLVWSDAPGAAGANPALVNDIDLRVAGNSVTWYGNNFGSDGWSQTGVSFDTRNNVENVWIENPSDVQYTITVDPWTLNGDAYFYNGDATDQHFSVVCYNCEEIVTGTYDAGADEAYAFIGLNGGTCSYGTIADAVTAASAGDTIYVPAGTYIERIGVIDKDLTITAASNDCTTEQNLSTYAVTVDANDAAATWGGIIDLSGGASLTLRNLYLRDGSATYGGLVYVTGGTSLTLDDTDLAYGTATAFGGALRSNGTTDILNGSFMFSNRATGSGVGAGVAVGSGTVNLYDGSDVGYCGNGFENISDTDGGGVYISSGTLNLYDSSRLCNNEATGNGGGLYATGGSSVNLSNFADIGGSISAHGNTAVIGGGAYLTGTATLSLYDTTTLRYNSASSRGGGVSLQGNAFLLLDGAGVVARDNTATSYGGAIHLSDNTSGNNPAATVRNGAQVIYNSANYGGAIYIEWDGASVTVENATVSNNTATNYGGAVHAYNNTTVTLNGATLANNQANNGGAISAFTGAGGSPYLNIDNAAIDGNTATNSGGAVYNLGGNLDVTDTSGATSISNNAATSGSGGAIYDSSGNRLDLDATSGSYLLTIDNNSAGSNGGAIYASSTPVDVYGSVQVTNNTATGDGGGLYLSGGDHRINDWVNERPLLASNEATTGSGGGAYLTAVDDTGGSLAGSLFEGIDIVGNRAPAGDGGGIYATGSTFSMDNVIVDGNSAYDDGGGLHAATSTVNVFAVSPTPTSPLDTDTSAAPLSTSCNPAALPADTYCSEFRNNSSSGSGNPYGGAVFLDGSTFTATDTAFMDNSANLGGAVYAINDADVVDVTNGRFTNNTSYTVRILGNGTLTLNSTTFAANTSYAVGIAGAAAAVTFNNNVIWGNGLGVTSSAAIGGNNCNISQNGIGGLALDPDFTTTARGDYHLGYLSNAIDACNAGAASDLDNVARPKDGDGSITAAEYDMGAFERTCPYGAAAAVTVTAAQAGGDVQLTWPASGANEAYEVHVGTTPYFTPSGATLVTTLPGGSTAWTHTGGTGSPGTNYYYLIVATNCGGETTAVSNDTAEFDFAVVPGS